ncbi:MAG: C2H2-type zinc finger protein [Thaumarchaeota archaeon]|nr:C2H2-type zinc finger protein [Nitrososphaerota archaeon]
MALITIDCREAEHLMHEMAVFVSDWLGAIPTMKLHEFVVSTMDDKKLYSESVVKAIREFFASIGETSNYGVLPKDEIIMIKSIHEGTIKKEKPANSMFSCSHCGYVTPYEVLLQNHMKIHYF